MRWYADARVLAASLAAGTPYTVAQTAGVIACLSPNVKWAQNVRAATVLVSAHLAGASCESVRVGLRASVERAWRVLDGDLEAIAGPKVRPFWLAMLGDTEAVVLDVWAFRAAARRDYASGALRADVERAYREGAQRVGVSPREFQATVWVAVRGSAS